MTGNIFLVFMEAYMEFLISSWLFFKKPADSYLNQWEYNAFIGFMIFMVVLILLLHIKLWRRKVVRLEMYKFQKKWGFIYLDINYKNKSNFAFLIYFYVRRLIYVLACFELQQFGGMQILVLFYSNLAALIFIGGFKPYAQ